MLKPSVQEILDQSTQQEFRSFAVIYPFEMQQTLWFPLYQAVAEQEKYHLIYESGRAGRYSLMAWRPQKHFIGKDQELLIQQLSPDGDIIASERHAGELLHSLKVYVRNKKELHTAGLPDIGTGLFGSFSYDLVREIEELLEKSQDDLDTPDVELLEFDRVLLYDHVEQQHWLLLSQELSSDFGATQEQRIEHAYAVAQQKLSSWALELQERVHTIQQQIEEQEHRTEPVLSIEVGTAQGDSVAQTNPNLSPIVPSFSETEFVRAVEQIQRYIAAGDVFQVNLSVRQSRPSISEPLAVYKHLRDINPSPYMGYLHFPDRQLICGSPEQLVKLKGRELSTRPIAGTRPRGVNREEDLRLAQELIKHPKERAEHVMLVDLERNDLGKVATFGSVNVDEFMVIEEYSHVMHIVSNVRGELEPKYDAFDVIRAVFPGGTITGAPKVRTMEIIEELEPVRRGIYTGAIGWISFAGDMELNIVIRTMLAQNGQVYVQAGAGIVIDSIPVNEYQESLNKAKALWQAYELSVVEQMGKQVMKQYAEKR